MSIETEITRINNNIAAAYTAASGKGATLPETENSANLATCIGSISGGGGSKYALLDRVKDDSNNEIGTVSGFFTDSNNVEYAVVCLDATYRKNSAQWTSIQSNVTMPVYADWTIWEAPETATENTQLILDWCAANSRTSPACTHCRQYSFTISGTTYYGQLPNIIELVDIAKHRTAINAADTSGGSITIGNNNGCWASNQFSTSNGWFIYNMGDASSYSKSNPGYVYPVLEIPNV